MVSAYQKHLDVGAAAVDVVLGENVRIEPKITNQHSGSVDDVSRNGFEIIALLRLEAGDVGGFGFSKQRQNVAIGVGDAILYIARAKVSNSVIIKKGDRVIALDRANNPQFEIERVNNRDHSRLELTLVAIGS